MQGLGTSLDVSVGSDRTRHAVGAIHTIGRRLRWERHLPAVVVNAERDPGAGRGGEICDGAPTGAVPPGLAGRRGRAAVGVLPTVLTTQHHVLAAQVTPTAHARHLPRANVNVEGGNRSQHPHQPGDGEGAGQKPLSASLQSGQVDGGDDKKKQSPREPESWPRQHPFGSCSGPTTGSGKASNPPSPSLYFRVHGLSMPQMPGYRHIAGHAEPILRAWIDLSPYKTQSRGGRTTQSTFGAARQGRAIACEWHGVVGLSSSSGWPCSSAGSSRWHSATVSFALPALSCSSGYSPRTACCDLACAGGRTDLEAASGHKNGT